MGMVNVSNLGFGGSGIPDALPQAVAELQNMRLAIVPGAAAGTLMPVAGMDPEDTIGAAVDITGFTNIPPGSLLVGGRNAFATITCLTTCADGDFVTVNGRKYTFKDVLVNTSYNAPPGVVPTHLTPSGSNPEEMAARLAKAIMSGDSTLTASVGPGAGSPPLMSVVTVKVRQAGTAGNSYTLSETGNAVNVSGATFTGGLSAANQGFTSLTNLAGKNLLIVWYDKHPGLAAQPLLFEALTTASDEMAVESLDPPAAVLGSPSFTLRVIGKNFGPNSVIVFAGHEEPTTFVSPTEVTTGVNMEVWHGPDSLPVSVINGLGDQSNSVMFEMLTEGSELPGEPSGETPSGEAHGGSGGHLTFEKNRNKKTGR